MVIGENGLPVTTVGTHEEDEEGQLAMELARAMLFNVRFFLSGLDAWKKRFEIESVLDTPNIFDCPLIPPNRLDLYREGLAAFGADDYVKCLHVLFPQVENSLRELLKILGVACTKTDHEGGFRLKNMNDILHDLCVRESLDEKLWFFLKVLYVDNRGINLRNLLAHGIAPVEALNRLSAGLVLQSVILLTMIRPEALFLPVDYGTEAGPTS